MNDVSSFTEVLGIVLGAGTPWMGHGVCQLCRQAPLHGTMHFNKPRATDPQVHLGPRSFASLPVSSFLMNNQITLDYGRRLVSKNSRELQDPVVTVTLTRESDSQRKKERNKRVSASQVAKHVVLQPVSASGWASFLKAVG